MSRSSACEILGSDFTTFRKSHRSESETDAYDKLGLYLYYDAKDELNFIETFPSCAYVGIKCGFFVTICQPLLKRCTGLVSRRFPIHRDVILKG